MFNYLTIRQLVDHIVDKFGYLIDYYPKSQAECGELFKTPSNNQKQLEILSSKPMPENPQQEDMLKIIDQ